MGLMGFLFAPRKDHKGWSTPSEAARLYFLLVLAGSAVWAWPLTQGNLLLWLGLVAFVATPLLTIGWWLISLVSQRFESRVLVDSLNRIPVTTHSAYISNLSSFGIECSPRGPALR